MKEKISFFCIVLALLIACKKSSGTNSEEDTSSPDIEEAVHSTEPSTGTYQLSENVYSFSADGEYISLFVIADDGVAVFETVNTQHAKAMVDAIRELTDKPIKYAFHSHNHWDHASGGQVFTDEGATTLAHKAAYQWMVANPGQDMAVPMEYWEGSRKDIELGEETIELHYLGMNHGLGLTIFVLPKHKLAYIADIVTPRRVLFGIVPDFNIREWERSLSEILEMNFEKALFSHNENSDPLAGGTKEDIRLQLKFIQDVRAGIYAEIKKGTNPFMIPGKLKLPEYENWAMYDEWLEMNVFRVLMDEWMGPYPWVPSEANSP